jgi:hypothetical protein
MVDERLQIGKIVVLNRYSITYLRFVKGLLIKISKNNCAYCTEQTDQRFSGFLFYYSEEKNGLPSVKQIQRRRLKNLINSSNVQ